MFSSNEVKSGTDKESRGGATHKDYRDQRESASSRQGMSHSESGQNKSLFHQPHLYMPNLSIHKSTERTELFALKWGTASICDVNMRLVKHRLLLISFPVCELADLCDKKQIDTESELLIRALTHAAVIIRDKKARNWMMFDRHLVIILTSIWLMS